MERSSRIDAGATVRRPFRTLPGAEPESK